MQPVQTPRRRPFHATLIATSQVAHDATPSSLTANSHRTTPSAPSNNSASVDAGATCRGCPTPNDQATPVGPPTEAATVTPGAYTRSAFAAFSRNVASWAVTSK